MFRLGVKRNNTRITSRHHSIVSWEPGQVRVAVIEMDGGTAQILGVAAAPIRALGADGLPDVDTWAAGCDEALTQAEDMTVRFCGRKLVPDWVTMSVAPEVMRGYPIAVRRERRDADSGVTSEDLNTLLRLGYRTAQDEMGAPAKEAGEDLVFGSVAEIILDDQTVLDPLGLHGRELQLRLNFYLLSLQWIRALEVVSDRLGLKLQSIVPLQAAYASPLVEAASLLIVIDADHTTVGLVRRGRLEWSVIAHSGAADVTAMAAQALAVQGKQVEALMAAYRAGKLQQDVELQLARAFWTELKRWMRTLAEAIGTAGRGVTFPHRIFVVDSTRNLPEAAPSLETPFWEGLLHFERCPEVASLESSAIRNVLDLTARANGPDYLAVRSLAHLAAQLYASEESLDCVMVDTIRWRTPRG
jgi:hypothetical protein